MLVNLRSQVVDLLLHRRHLQAEGGDLVVLGVVYEVVRYAGCDLSAALAVVGVSALRTIGHRDLRAVGTGNSPRLTGLMGDALEPCCAGEGGPA